MDTWAPATPAVLSRIHMDPEEPVPAMSASLLLGDLDDAALEAFAAPIRPGAPVLFGELRHLGGAVAPGAGGRGRDRRARRRVPAVRGRHRHGPRARAAVAAAARGRARSLEPYATGRQYLNFVEAPTDPAAFYADEDYARLRAIRAAVDPAGTMVGNHPVPAVT